MSEDVLRAAANIAVANSAIITETRMPPGRRNPTGAGPIARPTAMPTSHFPDRSDSSGDDDDTRPLITGPSAQTLSRQLHRAKTGVDDHPAIQAARRQRALDQQGERQSPSPVRPNFTPSPPQRTGEPPEIQALRTLLESPEGPAVQRLIVDIMRNCFVYLEPLTEPNRQAQFFRFLTVDAPTTIGRRAAESRTTFIVWLYNRVQYERDQQQGILSVTPQTPAYDVIEDLCRLHAISGIERRIHRGLLESVMPVGTEPDPADPNHRAVSAVYQDTQGLGLPIYLDQSALQGERSAIVMQIRRGIRDVEALTVAYHHKLNRYLEAQNATGLGDNVELLPALFDQGGEPITRAMYKGNVVNPWNVALQEICRLYVWFLDAQGGSHEDMIAGRTQHAEAPHQGAVEWKDDAGVLALFENQERRNFAKTMRTPQLGRCEHRRNEELWGLPMFMFIVLELRQAYTSLPDDVKRRVSTQGQQRQDEAQDNSRPPSPTESERARAEAAAQQEEERRRAQEEAQRRAQEEQQQNAPPPPPPPPPPPVPPRYVPQFYNRRVGRVPQQQQQQPPPPPPPPPQLQQPRPIAPNTAPQGQVRGAPVQFFTSLLRAIDGLRAQYKGRVMPFDKKWASAIQIAGSSALISGEIFNRVGTQEMTLRQASRALRPDEQGLMSRPNWLLMSDEAGDKTTFFRMLNSGVEQDLTLTTFEKALFAECRRDQAARGA